MGSYMNYKNFAEMPVVEGSGGKAQGNYPLARQPSIYSLTFDELQNTLGGHAKDFGSMNMDELLKNIWSAEETQTMTISAGGRDGSEPGGNLQRQGSLTLPRTLSQKTVDEVWRDLIKESEGVKDGSGGIGGLNLPQRQQTLGEMTLEEFLVRAGVVREDTQPFGRPNNSGLYGEFLHPNNNGSLVLGFQQSTQNNGIMESNSSVPCQLPSLALNVGGVGSSQQQPQLQQHQHQHQHQPPQLPPILPKQATLAFPSLVNLVNNAHLANSGAKGAIGITDQSMNKNLARGGRTGMVSLRNGGVAVATGSPTNQLSPDVIAKSNVDSSSLSPIPYAFNRGRKGNGPLEKVVERRQRRMIKNRESAARSRARKQAYTLELEAEVAKLKEMNEELQRKQAEVMKMQKNQILETMRQRGGKRQCLRRTLTGPW